MSIDLANGSFSSGTGWVKFESGQVRVKRDFGLFQFGSDMVRFGSISGQLIFDQIHLSSQNKQLCRNFKSGMIWFGSTSDFGPLSGEHISGVESGMGLGRSVRVLSLGLVLPDLDEYLKIGASTTL